MAIPVTYNLRNLVVRKTTTVMTALGIGLTVAVLLAILALVGGLKTSLQSSGNPLQVLVLRKGGTSELSSVVTPANFQDMKFKSGITRTSSGQPMASLEMVTVIDLESVDAPQGINVTLRGITPVGIEMRDHLKLVSGRWFQSGRREVVVGESIGKRFPGARIGQRLHFGRGDWDVVGIMSAGSGSTNSEIFGDLNQISADFQRPEALSSALLRATDPVAAKALINDISNDQRLNLDAMSETEYYDAQTSSGVVIESLGIFVSIIMGIGSSFAAMNTMYAAVARRSQEIGTLRVLGFSRGSILFSFFIESILLAALGGLVGCLLVLPLNGVTTGIGNFVTFSEIDFNFRITPQIMALGVAFAMVLGALGGLFPARSASRKEILAALRGI
ncbi:MAG TPA: ABC transporter permease [Bryobacteraceae bacterium]|nr:ABC transporter permease [Bryobacteraceae bacterium]